MPDPTRLADFDELIIKCRDEQAREYISEAIASYRSGAFRACIVTTWIAVVYYIIGKLRELASSGDAAAQAEVQKLENIVISHDVKSALGFESGILNLAKNSFSLLTQNEFNDLERLREDRQRCAHPSLNSIDQPYSPPAELARVHLRSAVQHLLMHEPVQGKAALDRLIQDVSSDYFPSNTEQAKKALSSGPLRRPKDTLVTNFTSALISSILKEANLDFDKRERRASALNATRTMHRALVEKTLLTKVNPAIRSLSDDIFINAIFFVSLVPDVWQFFEADIAQKIKTFTNSINAKTDPLTLGMALDVPELREDAQQKINNIGTDELIALIEERPRSELVQRAISLYGASGSFNSANHKAEKLIKPLVRFFTPPDVELLLQEASANMEVTSSFGFDPILQALQKAEVLPDQEFAALKEKYNIG